MTKSVIEKLYHIRWKSFQNKKDSFLKETCYITQAQVPNLEWDHGSKNSNAIEAFLFKLYTSDMWSEFLMIFGSKICLWKKA